MRITVELFGIPRLRAGVDRIDLQGATLGELLAALGRACPELGSCCLEDGRLRSGYIANVNGQRFVTDSATLLEEGDALLILSADVGG